MATSTRAARRFRRSSSLLPAGPVAVLALAGCSDPSAPVATVAPDTPEATDPLIATAAFDFGDDSEPGYASVRQGYVDDALCAECHMEQYEGYQNVAMSKTFGVPGVAEVIEDFENNHYYHEPSDRHYEMFLRDGRYFQRRYQLDVEGNVINDLEVEVTGIIGSGTHVRTFLFRNGEYEFNQLPLAWNEILGEWGMNPGFDKPVHEGFNRRITRNCMFCHNAYPEAPAGSDDYWEPAMFPADLPHGHGCQRCHGPGEQHVRVANNPMASMDELNNSVPYPSRLPPDRREDVCLVCHLLPSAGFPSRILRNGRPEFSHRPDEPLDAYVFHVDYEDPHNNPGRFEINHHAYRLFQSPCYTESDGELGCLTCHDPHYKAPKAERPAYNRANCLKCHVFDECATAMDIESKPAGTEHAGPAVADCVHCHMPKRRSQDVVHALATDHWIIAKPEPEEQRLAALAEFDPPRRLTPPRPYWDEHIPPTANDQLHLAIAGAGAGNPEQVERLRQLIDEQQPDFLAPYAALSEAYIAAGRWSETVNAVETLIRKFPDHGRAYTEYGLALERLDAPQRAIESYEKSLEIGPPMPETYLGLGTAHYRIGRMDEAIAFLEQAIELRQVYPVALLNLGMVYEVIGEFDSAQDYLSRALAAEPNLPLGYLHLGQVQWRMERREDALRTWRQGVKSDESDVRLCEARAMGYLYAAAFGEALQEANRGFSQGADEPTMLLVAAMAQHAQGNYPVAQQAFTAVQQALQEAGRPNTFVFSQLWSDALKINPTLGP